MSPIHPPINHKERSVIRAKNLEAFEKLILEHSGQHREKHPIPNDHLHMNGRPEQLMYDKGIDGIADIIAAIGGDLGGKVIREIINRYVGFVAALARNTTFPEVKIDLLRSGIYNLDHNLLLAANNLIINELDSRDPGIMAQYLNENPESVAYFPQNLYEPQPWRAYRRDKEGKGEEKEEEDDDDAQTGGYIMPDPPTKEQTAPYYRNGSYLVTNVMDPIEMGQSPYGKDFMDFGDPGWEYDSPDRLKIHNIKRAWIEILNNNIDIVRKIAKRLQNKSKPIEGSNTRTKQRRTKQRRTKRNKTKQRRTKRNKTKQRRTKQRRTKQRRTKRNRPLRR